MAAIVNVIAVLCACTAGRPVRLAHRPPRPPGSVVRLSRRPPSTLQPVARLAPPLQKAAPRVVGRVGPSWRISSKAAGGIEGYADPISVTPGEPVTLYVSTHASHFLVRAFRMGWYDGAKGEQVWRSGRVAGRVQRVSVFDPAATRTATAPWRPSVVVPTVGWRPGAYLLRLEAGRHRRSFIPLTVRGRSADGRVVIISPVTTWQAYNSWGCCDLYAGGDGSFETRSRAVSFDRPYLMENGAGEFIRSELGVLAEAERLNLPLDYVTDVDLQRHPRILDGARAVVSVGHDEYWSPAMRTDLARAVAAGTNVAFFGANGIFRRIRFGRTALGADRLEINYKIASEDPLLGRDDRAVTADWPDPPDPRPESRLLGGQYACNLETEPKQPGVIAAPHSWVFAAAHVRRGEKLPGLIGPETDAVQPEFPTPRPIEVLLHSPAPCPSNPAISYADTSYYVARSGAGVFDAGTIGWACVIDGACAPPMSRRTGTVTRRVTDNVLRAFSVGPAGRLHPAHDNLTALGITGRG